MKTTLYYFTGTGNSLVVARKIAKRLENAEVKSISKIVKEGHLKAHKGNIGIVYPVFAWGAPLIVEEFVERMHLSENQYVFAVATCGGTAAGSNQLLGRILKKRGSRLSAGYIVKDRVYPSSSSPDIPPIKVAKMLAGKDRERARTIDQRINEIVENIRNRKHVQVESTNLLTDLYGNMLHGMIVNTFKTESKNFWVDDKCKNCGVCAKICPVGNINMGSEGRPKWNSNCQACYACFHWCEASAIQYGKTSKTVERKHHPEVVLQDLL